MISIIEPASEHRLCNVCSMKADKEIWFKSNIMNSSVTVCLCDKCAHDLKMYLEDMEVQDKHEQQRYKPLCPRGYTNCISDPAYEYFMHPDWYKEMYGDKSPEEVVKETCQKRLEEDPDEKFYCYDDEDK